MLAYLIKALTIDSGRFLLPVSSCLCGAAAVATCVPILVSQSSNRPASIALLVEQFAPVPVGVLNFHGCCDLGINQEITFAELYSGFAILTLVIACVGLYGTASSNAARPRSASGWRWGHNEAVSFGWS